MACDGSREKDINVAFYYLFRPNNTENPPPLQSEILSAIYKIRKDKNRADVKAIN